MVFHLRKDRRGTALIAGTLGNVMEWYDFALYGFMASVLSQRFFPSHDATASLLATYGVFAAGFVMRPLGSALFGQDQLAAWAWHRWMRDRSREPLS